MVVAILRPKVLTGPIFMQKISVKLNQHRFITIISISSDNGSQLNIFSWTTCTYSICVCV